MFEHQELNDLYEALRVTPENTTLRYLLIRKLEEYDQYQSELEQQVQLLLQQQPDHAGGKRILAFIYFQKEKYSATIIILEELIERGELNQRGKLLLAKALHREGSHHEAKELYQQVIQLDQSLEDQELDQAYRIASHSLDDIDDPAILEKPAISFKDVGGMQAVKKEIEMKIIKPLAHPELFKQYGKKVGGGILLYGPPGCGKTYLARATAGEIDAHFINVGINDILDMWIGGSEKNLHDYFTLAREKAPCVLFFDEIDALGSKRSDMRQSAGKNVINQFLAELDGVEFSNEGILIIGATNAPWSLDTAFRRPGRFDRILFVPPPDQASKEAILKLKLADKPTEKINYTSLAKRAKHFSGADLNALIDRAVEAKLEQALLTEKVIKLTTDDLLAAGKEQKASTLEWFSTAKNYALFANQAGVYDDILAYLKKI